MALDVIEKIAARSATSGSSGSLNLALFTDGLKEEQARGITIDVARHYLSRNNLDLIIADTPGHQEFTRNMVTGTSGSRATLILVDATKGIVEQNRRHAYIASMLGVEKIIVLVNKMDLVGFSKDTFSQLSAEFNALISKLDGKKPTYIPISALLGDNVVERSRNMSWYQGDSVLESLENLQPEKDFALEDLRLVVQWIHMHGTGSEKKLEVIGTFASGSLKRGDEVVIGARRIVTQAEELYGLDGPLSEAQFPLNARVLLRDLVTVRRGDVLSHVQSSPLVASRLNAQVCWMDEKPMIPGTEYLLKIGSETTSATVSQIDHEVDITSYRKVESKGHLRLNDIAQLQIATEKALSIDTFESNRNTGRFILIDKVSKTTAGAGVILGT